MRQLSFRGKGWPSESRSPPGCRTLLVLTVIHWAGLAWGLCQAEGLMGRQRQVGVDVGMAMRFPSVCHLQMLMCVWVLVKNIWVIMCVIPGSPAAHECDLRCKRDAGRHR